MEHAAYRIHETVFVRSSGQGLETTRKAHVAHQIPGAKYKGVKGNRRAGHLHEKEVGPVIKVDSPILCRFGREDIRKLQDALLCDL